MITRGLMTNFTKKKHTRKTKKAYRNNGQKNEVKKFRIKCISNFHLKSSFAFFYCIFFFCIFQFH